MAIVNPIVSTAEIQTITVDATGGTFTVTWNGATTNALAFDVAAATFTTEMDAVADGTGNVVVTGGPGAAGGGTPYTLTWAADQGNVPAPTTDPSSLTGGAGTAAVATGTAGVSGLADPWLSAGAHDAPTESPIPDQGDWQWNMMEVAAWMAGEAWTDTPANVSPAVAAICTAANDTLGDVDRQQLKALLAVAPDGVIDTVDAGKETTREWMAVDWMVRTLLPMVLDYIDDTDVAAASADLVALPALAAGTFDEAATLDALQTAGLAVWAWQDQRELGISGGGSTWNTTSLTTFTDALGDDFVDRVVGIFRRWSGWDPDTGSDNGAMNASLARSAGRQAVWDVMVAAVPAVFFTGHGDDTFRQGGDYVPGSAFILLRDAVWALCSESVSVAVGGAILGTANGFSECRFAAEADATSILENLGLFGDVAASFLDLIDDLCAV